MKKTKATVTLVVYFCIIIILTACTLADQDDVDFFDVFKVNAKELLAPDGEDPEARAAANGANDFAFRLSAALVQNKGDENFVCSPYSVWMPLAALANATKVQYRADLLSALGAAGIEAEDVNRAASRMLYNLTKLQNKDSEEYHNPLKIANAIFVGNNVTLRNDFAQTFMDYYRGSSIKVDFSSPGAAEAVNRWASQNTNGLINEVVQEFDPETVAAIANAIYFSDEWERSFDPHNTKEGLFHAPGGDRTVSFMSRGGHELFNYYEDDKVQALPLQFRNGGGMLMILPRAGGAAEFLASMTSEYFKKMRQDYVRTQGRLVLPRFQIASDLKDLKDSLETLGVPLFDEMAAPLALLIEENMPLFITDAIQKAVIEVDESGATAAAVTVMGIGITSVPQPTFEMICDRPFIFILYEYTYDGGDQILFTGVVNQP